jgi:putative ABC transport system permease protein
MIQELRFALRALRKSPVFTAAAVLTFALGIGADTAVFSVVYGVLLRPLPYRDPPSLVLIGAESTFGGSRQPGNFSGPELGKWRVRTHAFQDIVGYAALDVALDTTEGLRPLDAEAVSPGFFGMIGEPMALGRPFDAGDARAPVAVISDGLWRREFGGAPLVVGRPMTIGGREYTIVGIAPADFRFPEPRTEVWLPIDQAIAGGLAPWLRNPRGGGLLMLARLKPGATLAAANDDVRAAARAEAAAQEGRRSERMITLTPIARAVAGAARPLLLLLLGAVGLVLLVACANVAQLMLVRQTRRARELAVRVALGASRTRLVAQAMIETALVAAGGGTAGVLLAGLAVRALVALEPDGLPRLDAIHVDGPALVFAAVTAIATALAAGLLPALYASREGATAALSAATRGTGDGPGGPRLRAALIVAELAVSTALLVGATLLARSFVALLDTPVGARTDHAVAALLDFAPAGPLHDQAQRELTDALVARARAIPGVRYAAFGTALPPEGERARFTLRDVPSASGPIPELEVDAVAVTPDFFRTLGIPLLRGRFFTTDDVDGRGPVMIMGATTAARLFGNHPLGHTFELPTTHGANATYTLVGIVGDVRYRGLARPPAAAIYLPFAQQPWPTGFLVARTTGDPLAVAPELRRGVGAVNRRIGVFRVDTLDALMSAQVAQPRFRALSLLALAGLAVVLAVVGVYGVVAYSASQRATEFGVRMALGATAADILRLVSREGLRLAAAGAMLGLGAAYGLTRTLAAFLYGVAPWDPASYVAAAAAVLGAAAAATWLPARRATRVTPIAALRTE